MKQYKLIAPTKAIDITGLEKEPEADKFCGYNSSDEWTFSANAYAEAIEAHTQALASAPQIDVPLPHPWEVGQVIVEGVECRIFYQMKAYGLWQQVSKDTYLRFDDEKRMVIVPILPSQPQQGEEKIKGEIIELLRTHIIGFGRWYQTDFKKCASKPQTDEGIVNLYLKTKGIITRKPQSHE